jgi:hypothetical protein
MLADRLADRKPLAADTGKLSTIRGKIARSVSTIAQEEGVVKGESSLPHGGSRRSDLIPFLSCNIVTHRSRQDCS